MHIIYAEPYFPHPQHFQPSMFRSKSKKKQLIPVYVDDSYIYGSQYPPPPVWYSPDIFAPPTPLKQKKHRNTWSFFEPSSHHHNHKSHKSSRKLPKSVHFTPSVIDRDEGKENTKRSRTFAEFFSGYTSRQKDTKKRYKDYRREENHVSATVDPRILRDRDERKYRRYDDRKHDHDHRSHHRRERSHSEPHVHFQPESIYYLGDSTSEPLFLSPRESRERRQRERNLEKFLAENHGRDRYAQSKHEYIERKQVPPGPGLRRKKAFWRGAPV